MNQVIENKYLIGNDEGLITNPSDSSKNYNDNKNMESSFVLIKNCLLGLIHLFHPILDVLRSTVKKKGSQQCN